MSVCVFGSINMDVVTSVEHLPCAGQTLICKRLDYFPGGKGANQAIAAARLGSKTTLIGAVGRDQHGATLSEYLARNGVDVGHIQNKPGSATGQAFICVSQAGENTIVVAPGANARALLCRAEQTIIVTLGARGALAVSQERSIKVDGYRVASVKDTTGAGDCFSGALAARLQGNKADIESAMRFANLAAAISVTRLGATSAMPTREEVNELSRRGSPSASAAGN